MKTKVTKMINKQNLEHFQMINWILLSHKFCNNSKMLLSSSWAIFIGAVMFSFSPRANFSSLKYLSFSFLLVFQFILIEYERVLTEKQLYYHKDWEVPIMLYYLFWYTKSQSRSFLIQLETTMQWSEQKKIKIICDDEKF